VSKQHVTFWFLFLLSAFSVVSWADEVRDPVKVHVPPGYTGATAVPLVLLLHGYGASGALEEHYMNLSAQADADVFLLALPNGTKDAFGMRYWNATDACCSHGRDFPDDSTYLLDVIDQLGATYNVDPLRIYVVGHSNGGFMAHRLACDHADRIAAVVSLEAATWEDQSNCNPARAVAVLEIHGTADHVILYRGNCAQHPVPCYPAAPETVADWAVLNHCDVTPASLPVHLNLTDDVAGNETDVLDYPGCDALGAASLWTVNGGTHTPGLSAFFSAAVVQFLLTHHR